MHYLIWNCMASSKMYSMIQKINLDKIGIGASLLCAIHCAALPVLFTTLPLLGVELLENEKVELGFILFSLVVGSVALYNGYKKHHRKKLPLALFIMGMSLLFFANFYLEEGAETLVKMLGAATIIWAHVRNWQGCRQCDVCKLNVNMEVNLNTNQYHEKLNRK